MTIYCAILYCSICKHTLCFVLRKKGVVIYSLTVTATLTCIPIPAGCTRTCHPLRSISKFFILSGICLYPEDGGSKSHPNAGTNLPDHKTSHSCAVATARIGERQATQWAAYRGPWISHRARGLSGGDCSCLHRHFPLKCSAVRLIESDTIQRSALCLLIESSKGFRQ